MEFSKKHPFLLIAIILSGCGGGGETAGSNQDNIEVSNSSDSVAPPAISFGLATHGILTAQHPVTYSIMNGSLSSDSISYTWDFNDGTAPKVGTSVIHTYNQPGDFKVVIRAFSNGIYSSKTFSITVSVNSAPTVEPITLNTPFMQGAPFTLAAKGYDKDGDSVTYQWDFGDGTPLQHGQQISHAYKNAGSYKISLSADDGFGGTSLIEQIIFVEGEKPPIANATLPKWNRQSINSGGSRYFWSNSQVGYKGADGGNVYKTIDGGSNWENMPLGIDAPVFSLFFFDEDHGIAGTSGVRKWLPGPNDGSGLLWSEYPEWGMLMFTSDGGKTWISAHEKFQLRQSIEADGASDVRGLFFHDSQSGWAVGSDGYLGQTTDGGKTWKRVNLNTKLDLTRIYFIDSMHGWIIAEPNSNFGYLASVFRTEDGGKTWVGVAFPTSENYTIDYIKGVNFSDKNTGWACASGIFLSIQYVFRTLDGGRSWKRMPAPPFGEISNNIPQTLLSDIYSINENEAIVLDNNGDMYRTRNAGYSWTKEVK